MPDLFVDSVRYQTGESLADGQDQRNDSGKVKGSGKFRSHDRPERAENRFGKTKTYKRKVDDDQQKKIQFDSPLSAWTFGYPDNSEPFDRKSQGADRYYFLCCFHIGAEIREYFYVFYLVLYGCTKSSLIFYALCSICALIFIDSRGIIIALMNI